LAEVLDEVEAETFLAFFAFFTLAVVLVDDLTLVLPAFADIEVSAEVVFPTEAPVATEASAARTKLLEANKAIKAIANNFFMVFLLKIWADQKLPMSYLAYWTEGRSKRLQNKKWG
jgi:hypothetical protein